MCSWSALVRNSDKLIHRSEALVGKTLTYRMIKGTLFDHFCAGEDEASIRPTVQKLHSVGVGGILDYAAEDDISAHKITLPGIGPNTDEEYDRNVQIFFSAISAVHNVTPEGFAAIKITALGPPEILEKISSAIVKFRQLFTVLDLDGNGIVTSPELKEYCKKNFNMPDSEIDSIFASYTREHPQTSELGFDYVDWGDSLHLEEIWSMSKHFAPEPKELEGIRAMLARVYTLADYAHEKDVRLMVDAEATYFQPAIDHLVNLLQKKYNRTFPTIFHTYQAYLKDSLKRASDDLERAKRGNYYWAAKIVRGAYMRSERERAEKLGIPDPIFPTIEKTHQNYKDLTDLVLKRLGETAPNPTLNFMVASHNQGSIEYTLKQMEALNIDPKDGGVYFGQLLGMSDNMTFSLGSAGYKAYKYVPYGPIHEVMPYLIRRAQENSTLLAGKEAAKERHMLGLEIARRLRPF